MSQRDVKTVNTVADAYRSMYAKPIEINEDILNEELIDSLIEEVRDDEQLDENIQSVVKKYPRDNAWKKLVMKHKRHVDAFKKGKDMPKKVEDEFLSWAMSNNEIQTDDADESDEWLMDTLGESKVEDITEAMSKPMTVQQYANKIGIDAKEKQWIIDNEKDIQVFLPNDKLKGWSALSYPIRNNDYYFAFLTGDDDKRVTAASRANMMMNNYLKSELAKAKKLKFDDEPYTEDMIASHLWNFMSKEFEKLPSNLGAGDTMVREELYKAIYDITNGGEVQFESFDYQGETIQEGMLSGIVGKIINKIRSARKKVGKKIRLGKKAKSPKQLQASHCSEAKYDANILKSVADTYAQMQKYGIQGDVVEDLQEVNSVMSVDKKNMPKAKPMIQKLARARGVPVSFDKDGIGVTFKGRPKDVDKLMRDFEKNKTLMKLLEEIQIDEGKGTDIFKKYNKVIGRMSDKEQGEILDALYTMNTQKGARYKDAWSKVKELLNMEYTPEETQLDEKIRPKVGQSMDVRKRYKGKEQKSVNKLIMHSGYDKIQKFFLDEPKEFDALIGRLAKLESVEQIDEVQKVEVDSMKKVSKQMQAVLKSYQAIANKGDKELKDTKHNASYKKVLDARDSIVTMIGTLNTKMLMQKENLDERVSGDDTPMSMMVHSKDLDVFKKLKVIASKAGVKLKKQLKGIEVTGPVRSLIAFVELMEREPSFKKEEIEFQLNEASAGGMIDKLFNLKGNKDAGYGVAKLLNMTGVKVIQGMQKQNPQGFMKTVIALGKEKGKMQIPTNNALMKMFKQQGIKVEGLEEKVKDGKLDPLSPMGKSKLTGREISNYYKNNPKQKVAARDKSVKKAIELALDLGGNMNYAMKEIEKFKRGLSRNPAVKLALKHANESKEWTGHHVVIEQLSPKDLIKLKTYGKMLAKITKLPFDDSNPEKSIDKLMGQIWNQKHSPANWDRLHKMVGMLKSIGVKMPSLKGKYMGYDPVAKKSIFYKEDTDEMVEWHQKIEEIKEGIEELVEKKEMSAADIKKIAQMTDRNDHNGSLMHLAKLLGDRKGLEALKGIMMTHKALGHMPDGLIKTRNQIHDNLMRQSSSKYSNHKDVISSF
jgi:hypothetical protein